MKVRSSLMVLLALVVSALLTIPTYAKVDPKTCIGAWLSDEENGDTAIDSSENQNDGTLFNGPERVDGMFGKALSFDGVDDYINLPTIVSDNWEGLTVLAWVWLELLPNELASSYDEILGSAQDIYDMYEDKSNNELRVKVTTTGGAERPGIPTAQLETEQWIHIAGVYDKTAGKMMIYMNGELVDTHNLTGFVNGTQYSSIGAQGGPDGPFTDFHNGLIDEVALFSATLSDEDIQSTMDNGLKEILNIAAVVRTGKLASTWAGIKSQQD